MAKKKQPVSRPVSVEIDGKTYTGSYVVEGGTVTVTYGLRTMSTHSSGGPNDHVARGLLRDLVPGGTGFD